MKCIIKLVMATIAVAITFCAMYAQKHDYNWVSGYGGSSGSSDFGGTDIHFTTWPPTLSPVERQMDFFFNSGAISDEEGELLFYTNGCYVNGKDHQSLINGDSLNPGFIADIFCTDSDGYTAEQGSTFIPVPGNPNLYYLFHLGLNWNDSIGGIGERFYYTLLDKTLDNGRGDVVLKNQVLLEDTLAVGIITATKHANGRDWWIVVPEMSTPRHYIFLLTPYGIEGPTEQVIGNIAYDDDGTGNAVFSPDGSLYARFDWYNKINLFDFDRCTGQFSNPRHWAITIPEDTIGIAGSVSISPNSRYLYVTATWRIFQYDLWADDIKASEQLVAIYDGGIVNFPPTFFTSQLGPDGRIYINVTGGTMTFHLIEMPNRPGLDCKVKQRGFPLLTYNGASMCFFPNYRLGPLDGSPCDTLGLNNFPLANFRWDFEDTLQPLQVTFTDLSAYEPETWVWDFGDYTGLQDTSPVHVFNDPGIYHVCLTASNQYGEDTQCYDVPVGVKVSAVAEKRELEMNIYPNPFTSGLKLELPISPPAKMIVILYDQFGRQVAKKSWYGESLEWSLEKLPAGMYFYEVKSQFGQKSNGKLIKIE